MIKLQMINRTTSSSSPYHPHRPFFDELKKKKSVENDNGGPPDTYFGIRRGNDFLANQKKIPEVTRSKYLPEVEQAYGYAT
jgi:hypothetical protein